MGFSFAKAWIIAGIMVLWMIAPHAQDAGNWIEQLKSQNPQAASELVQMGKKDPEILSKLYELLEEESLRSQVAFILGEIGNPNAAIILQGKMTDANPAVRREIAIALLKIGPQNSEKPVEWFTNESDVSVKVPLAGLLFAVHGQTAELSALSNDPNAVSHFTTLTTVLANSPYMAEQIKKFSTSSKLDCSKIWISMFTTADSNAAQQTHVWLCRLSGENFTFITDDLEKVARTWQNWATNETNRMVLHQAVLQLASSKKEEVDAATQTLLQQKQMAYPLLIAGLRDGNFEVRVQCLQLLAQYPEQKAEIGKLLRELLNEEKDKDPATMLHQIVVVLPNFAGSEAISDLTPLLDHSVNNIREDTIWSLRLLQDEALSSKLVQRLSKEIIPEVRATILRNLALTGSVQDITTALQFLASDTSKDAKNNEVALAQADCAALLDNAFGWQTLATITANQNYDALVRRYAISRLLHMVTETNVSVLIPLLANSDLEVRTLAFQKINEITLESFDYDPEAPVLDQIVALGQWKKWADVQAALAELPVADAARVDVLLANLTAQGEIAAPGLLSLYAKSNTALQEKLLQFFVQLPIQSIIEHLSQVSQGNDSLAITALRSLAQIYATKNDPLIFKTLQNAMSKVGDADKLWLAGYLAVAKDATAIAFLKQQLQDPKLAAEAASILRNQQIQNAEFNPILAGYLASNDAALQSASMNLLISAQEWSLLVANFEKLTEAQKLQLLDLLQLQAKAELEKLLPVLSNVAESEKVRVRLADMLSRTPATTAELLKLLKTDLPEGMLKSLVVGLFSQKAITSDQMVEIFAQQKSAGAQKFLIQALPEEDLLKQVGFLQSIIKGKYDDEVITEAIKRSLQIPEQDIAALVFEILPQQPNASLRNTWLTLIDRKIQAKHLADVEKLFASEKEDMVRGTLVSTLSRMTYDQIGKLLQKIISEDPNTLVRQEALAQLMRFQKPEVVEFLLTQIKHPEAAWRKILYENLAKVALDKVTPELEKAVALETPDFAALSVLAQKNPEKARDLLAGVFAKCTTLESRQTVLEAISAILTKDQVEILLTWMPEKDTAFATKLAQTLDKLTGTTSNFEADKQEKSIELWKNWVQQWQSYTPIIASITNAEEKQREEAIQKLLAGGAVGRDAVAKSLEQAKTIEQKNLWLNILARFKDAQAIQIIRYFTEATEWEVRNTAYQNLIQLGDADFASVVGLYYFREMEPMAKITLFTTLTKEQQSYYAPQLQSYLPQLNDAGILKLIAISQQLSISQRRALLVQILQTSKDALVLEKGLVSLATIAKLQDIVLAQEVLKKTEAPQTISKALDLIRQFGYFATENTDNKEAFLKYYAQNQEVIQNLVKAGQSMDSYLETQSFQAEKNLASLPTIAKQAVTTMLLSQVKNETNKLPIIKLLGIVGELASVQPAISEYLTSDSAQLRLATVNTLAKLGWDAKSELVQKATENEDPIVRLYAIKAIGLAKDAAQLSVITKALNDGDSRVREEALFHALNMGFNDIEIVQRLMDDNAPNVREQAIKLAANLKMTKAMGKLLADLNHPFPKVRQAAYESLKTLSGQNFDYDPNQERNKQLENLIKWQSWYLIYQTQQQAQELAEKFAEKDIDKAQVRIKLVDMYNSSPSDEMKTAILNRLVSLLKDERAELRAEIITTLAEFGGRSLAKDFADLLLDQDLNVRQAALNAIAKLTNSKFDNLTPIAYSDDKTKGDWTNAVNTWLPKFKQDEQALIIQNELQNLAKVTQTISGATQIISAEQIVAAKKVCEYLKSPYLDVRVQAFNAIRPFQKRDVFQPNGTPEDREKDLVEIDKWLDALTTDAQDFEKELPSRLQEIAEQPGDLNTLNGCLDLLSLLKLFERNSSEPSQIQQKYVEVLTAKGCNLSGYNIYADTKAKKAEIFKAQEAVAKHYTALTQAAKQVPTIKAQLKTSFSLTQIGSEDDIRNAELLVTTALTHLDYSLRQDAIDTLKKLSKSDLGYRADALEADRNAAIEKWKNWLGEQREWLKAQRLAYEQKVQDTAKALTKIATIADFNSASLLLLALQDQSQALREQALAALTTIAGNNFGYQANVAPEQQMEALGKWQNWFAQQGNFVLERQKIVQAAQDIKANEKITMSQEVEKIAILIQAMEHTNQDIREIAFDAISTYVHKHAANQVREDFGYDPKAPDKVREEPMTHWKKWLQEKVQPIGVAQEQRLQQVKTAQQALAVSKAKTIASLADVDILIKALNDEASIVRDTAQTALHTISQKNYQTAKQWQFWMRQQNAQILKLMAARKYALDQLMAKVQEFSKLDQEADVQKIAAALEDQEPEVRVLAVQWFEKQSNQKFVLDATADSLTKAKAAIQDWIATRKASLLTQQYTQALSAGVRNATDLAVMKNLAEQINSPLAAVRSNAFQAIQTIVGQEIAWGEPLPTETKDILAKLEPWLTGQEEKFKLMASFGSLTTITTKQDFENLNRLVDILAASNNVYVRTYAVQRLQEIAKKTFAYKPDASDILRKEALKEIEAWVKTVEVK